MDWKSLLVSVCRKEHGVQRDVYIETYVDVCTATSKRTPVPAPPPPPPRSLLTFLLCRLWESEMCRFCPIDKQLYASSSDSFLFIYFWSGSKQTRYSFQYYFRVESIQIQQSVRWVVDYIE